VSEDLLEASKVSLPRDKRACSCRWAPPTPVPQDPVGALEGEQRGLAIDPWTPTPRWDGLPLDVDWALFTLWQSAPEGTSAAGSDQQAGGEGVSAETPWRASRPGFRPSSRRWPS
jgi:hypothetical protein